MTETQVILLLSAQFGLVGGALGIWWRIEARIKAGETAAALRIEASNAQAQMIASQLAAYKTHVAENFVTKNGLREQTEQIMAAIGDVKNSMTGLTSRMDRIIEDRPSRSSA